MALLCFLHTPWAHYKSHPSGSAWQSEGHVFYPFLHSTNAADTYCVSATSDMAALAGAIWWHLL